MTIELYLDLDGLFADFDGRIRKLTGRWPWEISRGYLWATVAKDDRFYYQLELYPESIQLWEFCKKHDPWFLTGAPSMKSATVDKQDWTSLKFGDYWKARTIVLPKKDKPKYAKSNAILVDDTQKNLSAWAEAGGIAVWHAGREHYDQTLTWLKEAVARAALALK